MLRSAQGGDQQKKVSVLSGGERNRCQLAKVVKSGANVLLLDEVSHPFVASIRSSYLFHGVMK